MRLWLNPTGRTHLRRFPLHGLSRGHFSASTRNRAKQRTTSQKKKNLMSVIFSTCGSGPEMAAPKRASMPIKILLLGGLILGHRAQDIHNLQSSIISKILNVSHVLQACVKSTNQEDGSPNSNIINVKKSPNPHPHSNNPTPPPISEKFSCS